jgi:hypothetical protein
MRFWRPITSKLPLPIQSGDGKSLRVPAPKSALRPPTPAVVWPLPAVGRTARGQAPEPVLQILRDIGGVRVRLRPHVRRPRRNVEQPVVGQAVATARNYHDPHAQFPQKSCRFAAFELPTRIFEVLVHEHKVVGERRVVGFHALLVLFQRFLTGMHRLDGYFAEGGRRLP